MFIDCLTLRTVVVIIILHIESNYFWKNEKGTKIDVDCGLDLFTQGQKVT